MCLITSFIRWEVATEEGDSAAIAANVQEWREDYMIRRDKQILDVKLPGKIVETCSVKPYSSELAIYSQYEKTFLKALHGTEREILFFSLNIIMYVVY